MRLAHVIGTVSVSTKDSRLETANIFVTDLVDSKGVVVEAAVVALDMAGASVGDVVLVATGSAARVPSDVSDLPIDATIIGVVNNVSVK